MRVSHYEIERALRALKSWRKSPDATEMVAALMLQQIDILIEAVEHPEMVVEHP